MTTLTLTSRASALFPPVRPVDPRERLVTGRDWTTSEVKTLKEEAHRGPQAVADLLGRSVHSVRCKASEMRVSMRRRGSRCGLVLGQPRGVSLRGSSYRDLVLTGKIDPRAVLARMELEDSERIICPSCGLREATTRSGLCGACHVNELTDAANARLAELEAKKPLQVAWQHASRLKREGGSWNSEAVDQDIIDARARREARAEA